MMKVDLVCVGKLKEGYLREACAEYEKRLTRFCDLKITELPERRSPEEEAEDILRACKGTVFVLAVEGKEYSSEEFAGLVKAERDAGRELTLVIGSSEGLSARVKREGRAISFSKMTFPHQLFRVILLEQLYRAFMINAGAEYHK